LLGNDSVNTFPRQRTIGNNRITYVAMESAVNTTIEEEVFSMWFAYIHFWATNVFSMDPPQDYISGTVVNQKSVCTWLSNLYNKIMQATSRSHTKS
jgi:hypothetical protein